MTTSANYLPTMTKPLLPANRYSPDAERLLRTAYLLALVVADAIALALAFRLAHTLRFGIKLSVSPEVVPLAGFYTQMSLVMGLGCILLFFLSRLYYWNSLVGGSSEYSRVVNTCTVAFLLVILATFVFPTFIISRLWLIASWCLACIFVCIARFTLRRVVYALRERGHFLVRAAIVGANSEGVALAKELQHPWSGYRVVGLVSTGAIDLPKPPEGERPMPVLGNISELGEFSRQLGIQELVVSSSSLHRDELFALYAQVHGVPGLELRLSTGLFELLTTGVQVRIAGVLPLIGLKKLRLSNTELFAKTIVEYAMTIPALILLSPFLALLALAVRLDSPGPALYRRRVLGIGGKEFDAYKFRTMYVDGDKILEQHPDKAALLMEDEKLRQDPRITRLGRFMRRYSLDELPQLFNVLMGQMSLVGPRMISPREAEKYGRSQFNLLTVKPGITGLWQVSGRSSLSYKERIRLDMYYVRNYTIWLDFHILFIKTANAVLRGHGAY
jgi:exopolysaccharide biosynthesis polyprenyl glycosylphosphotransferase